MSIPQLARTGDLFVVICLWTVGLLAAPHIIPRLVISTMSFFVFVRTMRLHSISAQCEADNMEMYEYLFGLRKSRDSLASENASLARLIVRRKMPSLSGKISSKRRNSSACDLRECIASRILTRLE